MRWPFPRKPRPSFSRRRRFEQSQAPAANPYLQRHAHGAGEERYTSSRAFVLAGIGVVILGLFYLFSFDRSFELSVSIEGTKRSDPAFLTTEAQTVLQQRLWGILRRNKYTTLSRTYFREAFLERVGKTLALDHIDVRKQFPNRLRITVYEREPELIWVTNNRTYLLDAEGIIVQEAPELPEGIVDVELAVKPRITDANSYPVEIGSAAIIPETPQAVLRMHAELLAFGFVVTGYAIPEISCEILFPPEPPPETEEGNANRNAGEDENTNANENSNVSNLNSNVNAAPECDPQELAKNTRTVFADTEGFIIRFSAENLDQQIAKLDRLKQEKFFEGRQLTYIDIRFGERVYYQ